jgi:UDP-N-acetylglucosamine acyltransferase
VIDPHALVAPGAELAPDVEVGPFAVIGPQVKLGSRTRIGPHAVVTGHTTLGADNAVFQFASIGDAPQDLKYAGEPTRVEIGDRNIFREGVTVNRGTVHDAGVTRIGSDCLFMAGAHVAHDCQLGSRIVMANGVLLGGHVKVGDWVIFGGFAGVHQFCQVGEHAFIANNCAVTRDVPPFVLAEGRPAVPHSINSKGLERRGYTTPQIRNLREAFRTLFRSELLLADAVAQLRERVASQPEIAPFVDFISVSKRSLIR